MAPDALAAIAELERCYDGPIPPALRLAARLGSAELVERLVADGQAALFRSMILGQLRIIRARRADCSFYPALIDDLQSYRDGWRRWHRRRCRLRAALAAG